MKGPMLRFVIVTVLLIVLAIFYATRLGEEPEPDFESPSESIPETRTAPGEAPVAATVHDDVEREDWFPDLTGRNDVPGIDLGATVGRETFDCDIDDLIDNLGIEQTLDGDAGEEVIRGLLETFTLSGDAELQLAAGLLAEEVDDDRYGGLASIERAYRSDPMHPVVLWNAVEACEGEAASGFCADPQLQANVQTVLGSNGEYWALVSSQRYGQGDEAGALDALRRAAAAPEFDNLLMDNVRMLQRAFSMIPDTGYTVQALFAYVTAHDIVSPANSACRSEAVTQPEWMDACLALARRYETDGRTAAQQRTGASIQSRLFEAAGRLEEAEEARARRREVPGISNMVDEDMFAVFLTDERVVATFLEELEASGEASAVRAVQDEVERLKQDPQYHPCPPEDWPVAVE